MAKKGASVRVALVAVRAVVASPSYSTSWTPAAVGTYYWFAIYSGDPNYNSSQTGCADASEKVVISPNSTTTNTTPLPTTRTSGASAAASFTTTVTGADAVTPTGMVGFSFFNNASCARPATLSFFFLMMRRPPRSALFPSTTLFRSTPAAVASYYWFAISSGDTNYTSSKTGCADASEKVVISPNSITTSHAATPSTLTARVPATATDTATVTGADGVTPTGTVTFSLFNNSSCTGPATLRPSLPATLVAGTRSEERRVGTECRSRWSPDHYKKKDFTSGDRRLTKCKNTRSDTTQ